MPKKKTSAAPTEPSSPAKRQTEKATDTAETKPQKKGVSKSSATQKAGAPRNTQGKTSQKEQTVKEEMPAAPVQQSLPPAATHALCDATAHPGALDAALPPVTLPPSRTPWRVLCRRLLVLALLVALLVASVLIYVYRPTAYTERKTSVAFAYSDTRGVTTVLVNGTPVGEPLPGLCGRYSYNGDGNVCAALVGDSLYLIRNRQLRLVSLSVLDFVLSQNGKALAYRTAEGELFYCKIGRKPVYYSISRTAADENYVLSPDGKELFYTHLEDGVQKIALYSRTNSSPGFETTVGLVPVAVSDSCDHLYYRDAAGVLYYMDRKGGAPVVYHSGADAALCFNRDLSEVLIDSKAGTTLWKEGEQLLIPALEGGEHIRYLVNKRAAVLSLPCATQYLVKSFLKSYYVKTGADGAGAMLSYLDREGTLTGVSFISEAASDVTVTDHGVYYIEIMEKGEEMQRHLFYCKLHKTEPERLSFVNVTEFKANHSGDRLFYTDQNGALYTMKIGHDPVRLQGADSIVKGTLSVTADNTVYYVVGDTLWKSENGNEPQPLRETPTTVRTDAYTAYFTGKNASGAVTLHTNYRNRRTNTVVADDITVVK